MNILKTKELGSNLRMACGVQSLETNQWEDGELTALVTLTVLKYIPVNILRSILNIFNIWKTLSVFRLAVLLGTLTDNVGKQL